MKPYRDSKGILTIAVGHNLEAHGISPAVADMMLTEDIDRVMTGISKRCPWFIDLTPNRKVVIISMVFNLGISGFLKFTRTIYFIKTRQYVKASEEMLDSQWRLDVGKRANELSRMMGIG